MTSVRLQTTIPGPESQSWMRRLKEEVPRGAYNVTPVFIRSARGALLEDVDGNRFIDFAGGIGCLNVGHAAEPVIRAVQAQAADFTHSCVHVTPYSAYVEVAEALNRRTPGTFPKKTLLVSTGAEAVENAVKIARAFTRRPAVIAFEDAFHGRTLLAMTLTSKSNPYKSGFGPFAPEVYRLPYAYCYRCSYSLTYPDCELHCARQIENLFDRFVSAESVAAVIVEPVLGEGGFVVPPTDFFRVLTECCRSRGILMIADEIQTGFGRTGTLFACEQFGFEPDLLLSAKSLAGGMPLAAVTGRAEVMDAPIVGGLGGTFGGNPVSCRAALAVLEMFDQQNLTHRAQLIGERFGKWTEDWAERFSLVGAVRRLGAMCAIELVADRESRHPAREETAAIVRGCYERGLIVLSAGTFGNVIRILVPLVVTDEQFDEGMKILETAFESLQTPRAV